MSTNDKNWTPGPWRISRGNGPLEIGVRSRAEDQSYGMMLVICTVDEYDHPEYDANAHLIAAAPDGYALAELVMDICGNPKGISESEQEKLYETALQYTKKAKGKS